jgi:hypothetical protein
MLLGTMEAGSEDNRLLPRPAKAAAVLPAVEDKPFGVAAKRRPSLTAARHGSAIELGSGRKDGFAEVEQKNAQVGRPHANFSCSS